jgi:tetratricopeptide (TPR) repeat protein
VLSDALPLALADFQEAIRLNPVNGDAYNGRACVLARRGQHQNAIRNARAALDLGQKDARTYLNAAHVFAQVVGRLDSDGGQRKRQVLMRAACQEEAVRLLRRALDLTAPVERAAFWRDTVVPDAALRPIRPSPGFARLATDYTRRAEERPGRE